ncbi:kynurenine formamidase [Tamaricihabitans halophyticus]|uniref:Kynurenine formamidase n=1 Tax=Tamaricihabitans halophyticus TaxID=1262583 RepID=A0A4R2R4F3_9PSEU|nr:cyclase family protein [Tamaricihabitans halophyticus]TCP56639.1 kynurenine formamidase [Tamaricihabitans halophyticus]
MLILDAVSSGTTVYDLGQPLDNRTPCSPNHPGFKMALIRRHGDAVRPSGLSGANELISTGGHVGTHMDALCHVAMDGKLHGGTDAHEASVGGKFAVHGIDTVPPVLARGVLFDVPTTLGVSRLDPGYGITAEDLARTATARLREGDVALIRTGWPQLWDDAASYVGTGTGVPGIEITAAEWLLEQGVRAVGGDTIAFEQITAQEGHGHLPVHGRVLYEAGVNIIEVLNLEEIAAAGLTEFLFVCSPLKIVGGTGAPVRPLAVVDA